MRRVLGMLWALAGMGALAGRTQSGTLKLPPTRPAPAPPKVTANIQHILTAINPASTWGHPDLFGEFTGMRLYSQGHYKAAIKYFKYGASYSDKPSQLYIGLMYANGRGVKQDPAAACAWLALAAQRKYPKFMETGNRVCEALTPAEHDQAVAVLDKLLPVYGDKVAKRRMSLAMNLAKMETAGSRLGFDSGIYVTGPEWLDRIGGEQVEVDQGCSEPTMSVGGLPVPIVGCGNNDYWNPTRWNPKQYFAARDEGWLGTVTVGALKASDTSTKAKPPQPAPASSTNR